MSANHTPAPWHVGFRQNHGGTKSAERIVSENGDIICEGLHWNNNGEVDARLIAAAPELYQCLREVLDDWENGFKPGETPSFKKALLASQTAAE